jgi:hypothetical protein
MGEFTVLVLVLSLAAIAFFAGIVSLIAKLSGRQYPGQITQSLGREVDYDDPYPGWGNRLLGLNTYYERRLDEPPAVPFERWSESRSL